MRAVVYAGPGRVRVEDVPAPVIAAPGDAIVRVTSTSICASDLHLLHGKTPGMREGGVIGHEYVGIVEAVGTDVTGLSPGTRVLGSFLIACGSCHACEGRRFNHCSNRRALGLGALTGDLDGAQAEQVRVPDARLNLKSLDGGLAGLEDERALFAGDILSTGFYAASLGEITPGATVVVVGAGPVGIFCALAAGTYGPEQVLVLDVDAGRVAFAAEKAGLDALDVSEFDPQAAVAGRTGGRLADVTIDAVGSIPAFKTAMKCARDGGRVVVVGVYGAERYELPMGMVWIRGLDLRFSGMANIHAHWDESLRRVAEGKLDPTSVITHRLSLDEAEEGYELFASRAAMKVVMTP